MIYKNKIRVRNSKFGCGYVVASMDGFFISAEKSFLVEFDNFIGGHAGESSGKTFKNGYCWWLPKNEIEFIDKIEENQYLLF